METSQLRTGVHAAYSHVAEAPADEHPFKVGRAFAEGLGYPAEWLNRVPATSVEAFTGVSCVSVFAELPTGAQVLDVGCGAGLDSIIAGFRVGPSGQVLGIDFSEPMLARARTAAEEAGLNHVRFEPGEAERLPVGTASVDVALVNGIFNLNPARTHIMRELARVVKPGGALFCAELILKEPLTSEEQANLTNWFSWIAGAQEAVSFLDEFRAAGFHEATLIRAIRNTRTNNPKALAAEVVARK